MVLLVSYFTNLQIGLGVLTNHHTDLLVLLLKVTIQIQHTKQT